MLRKHRAIDALNKAYQEFESLLQKAGLRVSKYKRDVKESADRFNRQVTEAKGLQVCRPDTCDLLAFKF